MVNAFYKIYQSCILESKIEKQRESSEIATCSAMGRLKYVKPISGTVLISVILAFI